MFEKKPNKIIIRPRGEQSAPVRTGQGQVIGFAGMTGLATGPHVCFRFWKNGGQVDFLKQDFNTPVAMSLGGEDRFLGKKGELMEALRRVRYN